MVSLYQWICRKCNVKNADVANACWKCGAKRR